MSYACASAESLRAIAKRSPRVHCITNAVAMTYTANALLAAGAIPTMSMATSEITDFVAAANGLCINLGTLDDARRRAIELALQTAAEHHKPWVLDPVLVHVSHERYRYARELLHRAPSVIRGNAAEIAALAGANEAEAAEQLAQSAGAVVAQTGTIDTITDGQRTVRIDNGHELMARVTAIGCAESALVAAFLAVETDAFAAAVQALLAFDVAGELAAELSAGPGSFQIQILDQLYGLTGAILQQRSRLS